MVGSFLAGLLAFVVVMILGNVMAAVLLGGAIWFVGYPLMGVGGWLAALLRGEPAYRGSQHEESARAQVSERRSEMK